MTPPAIGSAGLEQSTTSFAVTPQQRRFFQTFGFVRFDGLFADDIAEITAAFDDVVRSGGSDAGEASIRQESDLDGYGSAFSEDQLVEITDDVHFGARRVVVPFVVDRHERIERITTDERFVAVAEGLVGPDYEVIGSDGNVFDCDTSWHFDFYGAPIEQLFVKTFLYLDPVDADHGALRVIPGTNHWDTPFARSLQGGLAEWRSIEENFGVPGDQIPYWSIDSQPGDLLVAYYRTLHATYGGSEGRRLICINLHGRD